MKLFIMHYSFHIFYMCFMDLTVESVLQLDEMQYELQNVCGI